MKPTHKKKRARRVLTRRRVRRTTGGAQVSEGDGGGGGGAVVAQRAAGLTLRLRQPKERWFIAVHEGGFGVDTDVAEAILEAQKKVAFEDKPAQLAIYVADEPMQPTGFISWEENGTEPPRLIGLTNTHQGWIRK